MENIITEDMYVASPCGCWVWQGETFEENGYAKHKGKYVHNLAYAQWVGEKPKGLTIDHLCANPLCVNPNHLEAVPMWVNARRKKLCTRISGWAENCARGHVMDDMNTIWRANGTGRQCRICQYVKHQEFAVRKGTRKSPVNYEPTWEKPHGSIKRKHEYEEITQELVDQCETTWEHVELLRNCNHNKGASKAITGGKPKTLDNAPVNL